ncbi:SCP2 sterol-binding domain-containing protein [Saprospira grandis]|uniref:SCP2 sterol-binding domain-containing protein n=1 Tax=Saprospira grandis TaxID=1008 RepID=UPI0022DE2CDA|nr:SCP2 sterol-binding domain-containing protein [Saprospira grandis]WBM73266.1 SCP2 sterol-binding domain-containing protein [Saprospira grandis]
MNVREFLMDLPSKISPEAIEGKESLFHFLISGEEGGNFTARIKDGKAEVIEGLEDEPKCVIKTSDTVFSKILSGKQNPQMAVFTGKLKISNLSEMMKFAKVLGLM